MRLRRDWAADAAAAAAPPKGFAVRVPSERSRSMFERSSRYSTVAGMIAACRPSRSIFKHAAPVDAFGNDLEAAGEDGQRILLLERQHRAAHRVAFLLIEEEPRQPSQATAARSSDDDQPWHRLDACERALLDRRCSTGRSARWVSDRLPCLRPNEATRPRCSRSIRCAVTDISAGLVQLGVEPLVHLGTNRRLHADLHHQQSGRSGSSRWRRCPIIAAHQSGAAFSDRFAMRRVKTRSSRA